MSHSFPTKYPFTCAGCGEQHPAETFAHYREKYLVADQCSDEADLGLRIVEAGRDITHTPDVMPRGKTAQDRCETCFQVPSSNGTCGCF